MQERSVRKSAGTFCRLLIILAMVLGAAAVICVPVLASGSPSSLNSADPAAINPASAPVPVPLLEKQLSDTPTRTIPTIRAILLSEGVGPQPSQTRVTLLGAAATAGTAYFLTAGVSAAILFFLTRRYPPVPVKAGKNQVQRVLTSIIYTALGALLSLIAFFVLFSYLDIAVKTGMQVLLWVGLPLPLVYLSLSNLVLATRSYSLHPGRGFTRSHLSAAILACITFSLFFLAFPARAFVFGRVVYPVLLLSTLLAFAQYREQEPGQADAASQETLAPPTIPPPGSEAATLTTLPGSGPVHFPVALCDRYTVLEPIGAGGMARVFRGVRKSDGRTVAVKIPKSNDLSTGTSFIKEISAWQHLSHQNIVEILDTNILPFPFIEMEYVPLSLEDIKKPVPVPGATRIVLGILEGLSYSHARGFVHRDLKPHNILLTRDGTPKISDWGLSTVTSGTHKMTLSGFSLLYAAPEQIAPEVFGPTGPWTDIYQVGIIFYELLTGRLPFGALEIETGPELLRRPPPEPPSRRNPAAAPIDPVVMKCLAASPRERYQTAEELLTALRDSQS